MRRKCILSQGKSAPPSVRFRTAMAEKGDRITVADAKQLEAIHKSTMVSSKSLLAVLDEIIYGRFSFYAPLSRGSAICQSKWAAKQLTFSGLSRPTGSVY